MKINVALFGLGRIGIMHAADISLHPMFNLKYVFDTNQKLSLKIARKFKSKSLINSSKAFTDKNINLIFIASSTPTHVPLIMKSAKHKKVIFCEKPIDLNINKVIKCRKNIKKYKPKIHIGFNRRYDPGHYSLKKSLLKGKIGKLEKIIITSRDPAPPSLKYLKASGGIYRDMTIHDFDLVRFYLGKDKIKEVFASASNFSNKKLKKINEYEISTCVLKSNSGVIAVINNSRHCSFGMDQRVEIFGTKGMLISGNRRIDETESYLKTTTGSKKPFLNFFIERYGTSYKLQLEDLAKFVQKKIKPRASFDDGEKSLIIANAAYKSLSTKKVVKIK